MKGFRTILFNAAMLILGLTGATFAPEKVTEFGEAFMVVWALGNGFFRAITNSPMFKKEAK